MTCKDGFLGVDGDSHTPFTTLSPAATAPLPSFFTRGHRHDVHMAGHRHDVHMAGGVEHLSSAGTKGPRVMAGFGHENGRVNLEIVVY